MLFRSAAEAKFEMSALEVEIGDIVAFTDESVPSYGSTITGWEWNFGETDGTISNSQNPTYAYKAKGTYVVRLEVTSSNGRTAWADKSIIVNTPYRDLAHASFEVSDKVNMNTDVLFTSTSIPAEGATIIAWEWSFGDGTSANDENPIHVYTVSGNYTVTLRITDSKNNTSTATKDINVIDPADLVNIYWRSLLLGAAQNTISPALSPDGNTVYAWADQSASGAFDVVLKAYDVLTGATKWSYNVSDALGALNAGGGVSSVFCSPAVGANGDIYVAARDLRNASASRKSFVFAITAEGTQKWAYAYGLDVNFNYETPAIDADGYVYVGHLTRSPFAVTVINPDNGNLVKSVTTTLGVRSGISLSKSGDIYFCTTGANGLFSYSFANATQNWQYNTNYSTTGGAISIDADGTVYNVAKGASQQIVSAVTPSGAMKWEFTTVGNSNYGGAVIGTDGTIYVNGGEVVNGTPSAGIYALNPSDGSLKWHFATEENVSNCVPLVDNRGYVHFITDRGTYYVLTDAGLLYGMKNIGTQSYASPVMNADGRVCIIAQEDAVSYVYCLDTGATGVANAAWPMKGQNHRRTGLQK